MQSSYGRWMTPRGPLSGGSPVTGGPARPVMMSKAEHFWCDRPELVLLGKVPRVTVTGETPFRAPFGGRAGEDVGPTQTRSHRHSHIGAPAWRAAHPESRAGSWSSCVKKDRRSLRPSRGGWAAATLGLQGTTERRGARLGGNAAGRLLRKGVVPRGPETASEDWRWGQLGGVGLGSNRTRLTCRSRVYGHLSWARRGQGVKGGPGPAFLKSAFFRRVRAGKDE